MDEKNIDVSWCRLDYLKSTLRLYFGSNTHAVICHSICCITLGQTPYALSVNNNSVT